MCDEKKNNRPTNAAAGGPGSRTGDAADDGDDGDDAFRVLSLNLSLQENLPNVKPSAGTPTVWAIADALTTLRRALEDAGLIECNDPQVWEAIEYSWRKMAVARYLEPRDLFYWTERAQAQRHGVLLP